jgi:hypothetical protein
MTRDDARGSTAEGQGWEGNGTLQNASTGGRTAAHNTEISTCAVEITTTVQVNHTRETTEPFRTRPEYADQGSENYTRMHSKITQNLTQKVGPKPRRDSTRIGPESLRQDHSESPRIGPKARSETEQIGTESLRTRFKVAKSHSVTPRPGSTPGQDQDRHPVEDPNETSKQTQD